MRNLCRALELVRRLELGCGFVESSARDQGSESREGGKSADGENRKDEVEDDGRGHVWLLWGEEWSVSHPPKRA